MPSTGVHAEHAIWKIPRSLPRQHSSSPPASRGLKQEARFTFACGIGQSVHGFQPHFRRDWSSLSSPKLNTWLSVFALAGSEGEHDRLFLLAVPGRLTVRSDGASYRRITSIGIGFSVVTALFGAKKARVARWPSRILLRHSSRLALMCIIAIMTV